MRFKPLFLAISSALALLSACGEKTPVQSDSRVESVERLPRGSDIPLPPTPGVYRLPDAKVGIPQSSDMIEAVDNLTIYSDSLAVALGANGMVLTDLWHRSADLCMTPFTNGGTFIRLQSADPRILQHGFDTLTARGCPDYWYHVRLKVP